MKNISVDHARQGREKNIDWQDYPCLNTKTGRRLPKTLRHYFKSWEDYLQNGDDTNYNTKD